MIIGSYPCCDGELWLSVPEETPRFAREDCPHCGESVWHKLSRLEPESWTEEAFLATHDLDHERKTITPKCLTP